MRERERDCKGQFWSVLDVDFDVQRKTVVRYAFEILTVRYRA